MLDFLIFVCIIAFVNDVLKGGLFYEEDHL